MKLDDYKFESNLSRAATLPSSWYYDPKILELEKDRVFAKTWQLVGREEQVAEAGQYFTANITDEPIVVARGLDEKLRAFSNVCRHRAGLVADGEGKRKTLHCNYHGWTYNLDGKLNSTPEFEEVECWNKDEVCLPQYRVETWAGLVFVNLDNSSMPLSEMLGDLPSLIKHDMRAMKLAARKDWFIDCNWKNYIDNYLEGYHIPIVHPALYRELDYANYRTETRDYFSIQHSPLRKNSGGRLRVSENADENQTQFFWVFPNLLLNVYYDNFSTNLIVPLSPEKTLTVFEWYFLEPENNQEKINQTVEFSDEIQIEDIKICETVQRNLHSHTYNQGRYSVKRENGVHHFHGLISKMMQSSE
jgi:choline monooxygenase